MLHLMRTDPADKSVRSPLQTLSIKKTSPLIRFHKLMHQGGEEEGYA